MKISISISPEEVTEFAKSLNVSTADFMGALSQFYLNVEPEVSGGDTPNNYTVGTLNEWFERISWKAFYFTHLVIIHSQTHGQVDAHGHYLDSNQLLEMGISERSASSIVGGSRRVCKSLNLNDILFIRSQSKENRKLFYVMKEATDDLMALVDHHEIEYKNQLEELEVEYPE